MCMDVMEAIRKRYSCRSYENRAVPEELLTELIEAARLAPSAKNFQDWRFVVVTDPKTREQLYKEAVPQEFVRQAPVIIAACGTSPYVMSCGQPIAPIDVAIAMEHIVLAATARGLGTCWLGAFNPHKVRQVLSIPSHIAIVDLLTVGWPAGTNLSPKRLSNDKIACRDRWSF